MCFPRSLNQSLSCFKHRPKRAGFVEWSKQVSLFWQRHPHVIETYWKKIRNRSVKEFDLFQLVREQHSLKGRRVFGFAKTRRAQRIETFMRRQRYRALGMVSFYDTFEHAFSIYAWRPARIWLMFLTNDVLNLWDWGTMTNLWYKKQINKIFTLSFCGCKTAVRFLRRENFVILQKIVIL